MAGQDKTGFPDRLPLANLRFCRRALLIGPDPNSTYCVVWDNSPSGGWFLPTPGADPIPSPLCYGQGRSQIRLAQTQADPVVLFRFIVQGEPTPQT